MAFEAFFSRIRSPELAGVAHHWMEARGARRMPGWGDIRPSKLASQLPFIWAYTYDAASDTFTGRLAGDRIEAIFGKTFRQTPLQHIFPPAEYQDIFRRAKRIVSEPAIFRGEGLVFRQLERFGYGERIILPLAGDGRNGDGLLGCTVYNSFSATVSSSIEDVSDWLSLRPA